MASVVPGWPEDCSVEEEARADFIHWDLEEIRENGLRRKSITRETQRLPTPNGPAAKTIKRQDTCRPEATHSKWARREEDKGRDSRLL
jgi:hypothetical protein